MKGNGKILGVAIGKKYKIVELYAGTGRSLEPFRSWRKAESALLVDVNPYAADVYRHNFRNAPYLVADLSRFSSKELQKHAGGRVDILLGCPPCQGYSDTGPRESNDPRNAHITRFLEYVRDLKPLAVAMENVPLAANSGRFRRLIAGLEDFNYEWTATIANATQWGSCQSRQRLILVAIRKGAGSSPKIPKPTHGSGRYFSYSLQKICTIPEDPVGLLGVTPGTRRVASTLPGKFDDSVGPSESPTVWDTIGDLSSLKGAAAKEMGHFQWGHTPETLRRMERVAEGGRWSGGRDHFSQTYGRLHRRGLSRTITTFFSNPGSGRFWHPTKNRALTLREAARIQGFPDNFQFLGHQSNNSVLVGNALDASLAKLSYRIIRESLG